MTKLQITITGEEETLLRNKAARLGYNVTKFAKFLLSRAAYQEFLQQRELGKVVKQALKDHEEGKTFKLSSIDDIDSI